MFKQALTALIFVIGAAVGPNALASSGNTSVSTGSASATVATPIQLVATGALRFGTIAQPQVGGTMTVSPYSAVTTTGDMGSDSAIAQTAPPAAASFSLTGIPGMQFTASGVSQVTISNGSATMTVGQFTINSSFSGGQIGANGSATFNIGGTLTASAHQAVGTYSGTFPITVTYY